MKMILNLKKLKKGKGGIIYKGILYSTYEDYANAIKRENKR